MRPNINTNRAHFNSHVDNNLPTVDMSLLTIIIKNRMRKLLLVLISCICALSSFADNRLSGTVIGSDWSYDYINRIPSTTVNTKKQAFDRDPDTFFASFDTSYGWVGLDLGTPHVITRVGWMPRNYSTGPQSVVLGVFEGANSEDFMDAVPIYMITAAGTVHQMSYADLSVSKGFRYVRYVGPSNARCNIAELEFYGNKGAGDDSRFYRFSNLPTVIVHTLNNEIPHDKETQIVSQLTVLGDDGHEVILTGPGTIRERGNGSREFPKRPYRIKFDSKTRVLGSPAKAKKWTLIPNYSDKTLMRNILAFEISKRLDMPYTPFSTPVDVILNGEYKGCYQLCDQVEVNNNRVNITEMTEDDNSGELITGGFLFEIDAYYREEPVYFISNDGNPVTIKSPDDDVITDEQIAYIENHFNLMENNKKRYLDLNTFLRHFIVGELSGNTDTYWSTYMYKQRNNDTIYTGPVWDFDLAFENDVRTYPINDNNDYIYRTTGSVTGKMRNFVNELVIDDLEVQQQLKDIWRYARRHGLDPEHLIASVDSLENLLQESQEKNFMRWDIMDTLVQQNPVIWGSFEAEVQHVRDFITARFEWMDNKLDYSDILVGDVNEDGEVTISDVTLLIDYITGNESQISPAADVNEDGEITIGDLSALIDLLIKYY